MSSSFAARTLAVGALALGLAAAVSVRADSGRAADIETLRDRAAATPTFAADIAPIIYANCVVCHRPGQSAPFSLLSYEDVQKRAKTIAAVTERRYMPPWHAARAEGFAEFRDERRLTDAQMATIKAWVAGGTPSGDLSKAPMPPVFPSGWLLGIPDLVVGLPRPIVVPAAGPDQYRNVTIAIDLPDDRWITAIDYQPTARQIVHHALYFVGPAGTAVSDDEIVPGLSSLSRATGARRGGGAGSSAQLGAADQAWGGLGGWVPGITPRFFPDGIAQPLPNHSNLVLQVHLHPSGKPEQEDGKLAFYFAKTPPSKSLTGVQVPPMFGIGAGIDIPAGEAKYTVHDTFELPVDVEAYGARGHAHYLGREMKMTAILPDGTTKGLLWIKDWDFGWQDSYFYKAPFKLPKGTKLDTVITYDNSENNPRNPNNPVKQVKWGRESFDEMGSMTLLIAAPRGADSETLRMAQAAHFRQQILEQMIRR